MKRTLSTRWLMVVCGGVLVAYTPAALAQWDARVEAAKREGHVNCTCIPFPRVRDAMLKLWAKDFPEIRMEYSMATLPAIEPQVTSERAAGRFVRDVYMFAPSPEQYVMVRRGFFEELRPLMILPEVRDPNVWRGGFKERFYDDAGRYVFVAGAGVNTMAINERRHRELGLPLPKSPLDILKPEYKGQIVAWELRFGSGGSNYLGWWNFMFGLDDKRGVQALLNQKIINMPSRREQTERLMRGGYLIGIDSPNPSDYLPFLEAGLKQDFVIQGREPQHASMTALYAPSVFKDAPNPNAAVVLFNWLLSKRVQETLLPVAGWSSARLDVSPTYPDETPLPGMKYFLGQTESSIRDYRDPAMELARKYYR